MLVVLGLCFFHFSFNVFVGLLGQSVGGVRSWQLASKSCHEHEVCIGLKVIV